MPEAAAAAAAAVTAYCVKCKAKGDMKDPKESTAANGRTMVQGPCTACGTKMTKFVSGAAKK